MSTDLQVKDSGNLPITDPGLTDNARPENGKKTMLAGDTTGAMNVPPTPTKPSLADGSKKTWGEKVYNTLVYQVFGFGINLGVSSLLTYLTLHSNWKIPFFFKKEDGPNRTVKEPYMVKELYTGLRSWLEKNWPTQNVQGLGFGEAKEATRKDRAKVMAGALVLTFGGHIMIPVIKFFEDRKTTIVEWLDKKHYSTEEIQSPEVQAAHERIAKEIRPTILSTVLARIGSVVAVQLSARTAGTEKDNFIKVGARKIGFTPLSEFPGIDQKAESIGLYTANKLPKSVVEKTDNWLIKATGGNKTPHEDIDSGKAEHGITGLLFKYGFSDIVYTLITAASIKPMNNWLIRNFSFLRKEPETAPAPAKPHIRTAGLYSDEAPETKEQPSNDADIPSKNISQLTHDGLLTSAPALQKA